MHFMQNIQLNILHKYFRSLIINILKISENKKFSYVYKNSYSRKI